jgi:hypothetical protein
VSPVVAIGSVAGLVSRSVGRVREIAAGSDDRDERSTADG